MSGTARGQLFVSVNGPAGFYQNGGGSIVQYAPDGTPSPVVSNLNHPRGLVFDGTGNLFVAINTGDNVAGTIQGSILKITPGGIMSTFVSGFPLNFFVSAIALDSAGDLFVNAGNLNDPNSACTIYKVNVTSSPQGMVSPFGLQNDCTQSDRTDNCSVPGAAPGLAFDSAGNLFAPGVTADQSIEAIYMFTSAGVRSVFAGTTTSTTFPSGQGPVSLAFDSAWNLFVSTNDLSGTANGDIVEFTPGGAEISPPFALEIGATGTRNSGPELLAFPLPNSTPPASGVTTAVTFTSVATSPGTNTVTPIPDPSTVGPLPTGVDATNAVAFDITTTATYTPPIIIAVQLPLFAGDLTAFNQLQNLALERCQLG